MEPLRAGIYCRVSTTKEAQEESIEQQEKNGIRTCKEMNFELVDFYREKKSATDTEYRVEYQRMLMDLRSGRINLIVVKDVYRLNRCEYDWHYLLKTIRETEGKIYFYLDRQFYTQDRSLEFNIKQMIGAEYSIDLSKKTNKAHRERQESGRSVVYTNAVWGYKKLVKPDGKKQLVVDEEEVQMVRLIFQYYLQGYGCNRISKILYSKGYRNHNGNAVGAGVINGIIKNAKVIGTAVMNKRHWDFNKKTWVHTHEAEWKIGRAHV